MPAPIGNLLIYIALHHGPGPARAPTRFAILGSVGGGQTKRLELPGKATMVGAVLTIESDGLMEQQREELMRHAGTIVPKSGAEGIGDALERFGLAPTAGAGPDGSNPAVGS